MYDLSRPQWTMVVTIFHGSSFGHAIELATHTAGRPTWSTQDSIGSWRGLGCPEEVCQGAMDIICTAFEAHIIERYGITSQLLGMSEVERPS